MKLSYNAPGDGYQAPDCEVIGLACDCAVLEGSFGTSIDDWTSDEDLIEFI